MQLGHLLEPDKELATYDEIIRLFADTPDLPLQRAVADAMWNKSAVFSRLERNEEVLDVRNDLIRRFRSSDDIEIRRTTGWALLGILADMEPSEDMLPILEDAIIGVVVVQHVIERYALAA